MQIDTARAIVEMAAMVSGIESDVQDQNHKEKLKWLTTVDPCTNHSAARAEHEPETGEWFFAVA
jgi:hypothetical protein